MNILRVQTSHDALRDTGNKTGFWLDELAVPYYVVSDAGATIALASPKGGQPPLDPAIDAPDAQYAETRRYKGDTGARAALATTTKLSDVDLAGNPPGPLPPIALKVPPRVLQNLARQFI